MLYAHLWTRYSFWQTQLILIFLLPENLFYQYWKSLIFLFFKLCRPVFITIYVIAVIFTIFWGIIIGQLQCEIRQISFFRSETWCGHSFRYVKLYKIMGAIKYRQMLKTDNTVAAETIRLSKSNCGSSMKYDNAGLYTIQLVLS